MARSDFPNHPDRRQFLTTTIAAAACAGLGVPVAEASEIARAVPSNSVEGWNLGLITAHRPELTAAENSLRTGELRADIGNRFGRFLMKGQYIPALGAEPVEERAFLLIGKADDSGNLKGFLRKVGRRFGQDAVVHKPAHGDAELHALNDLPDVDLRAGEKRSLGPFHIDRIWEHYGLMIRRGALFPPLGRLGTHGVDWLGGRWEEIGLWTQPSFLNPLPRRVFFDEAGKRTC